MTYLATVLWLLCLSCETIGQLVFKKASTATDESRKASPVANYAEQLPIWLGISCYAIEFFLYLAFLSVVPLAQGVLLSSLSIMTIMLGGRIFFGEKLSAKRVLAGMLITIGVSLVGWSG